MPPAAKLARGAVGLLAPAPRVDDLDLDPGERSADGAHPHLDRVIVAGLGDQGRGLGLAVADRDLASSHVRRDSTHQLDRARAPRHDPGPKRAEVATRVA